MKSLVQGLDFGSEKYHDFLNTFLTTEAEAAIKRKSKVWLYSDSRGKILGFSSLGPTKWPYPTPDSRDLERVLHIPAVALRREFWGRPKDCEESLQFSSQVMAHLLYEAAIWPLSPPPPALTLYVHPENTHAITYYEKWQFVPYHAYFEKADNTTYQGYLRKITR